MSKFNNACTFDKAFKIGELFDDVALTKRWPCTRCKVHKELEESLKMCAAEKMIIEDKYKNTCKECTKILTYNMHCQAKLKEYEKIDISTEHLKQVIKCK